MVPTSLYRRKANPKEIRSGPGILSDGGVHSPGFKISLKLLFDGISRDQPRIYHGPVEFEHFPEDRSCRIWRAFRYGHEVGLHQVS